jgi:hypothetical protein
MQLLVQREDSLNERELNFVAIDVNKKVTSFVYIKATKFSGV